MKYIKKIYLGLAFSCFTLISAESLSAQTARISASAIFTNGETKTFTTQNTVQQNFDAAGNVISQTITPTSVLTSSVSGPITTVSAESSLPTGFFYSSATPVVVTPQYTTFNGNDVIESLSLGAGAVTPVGTTASFTQAAARILLDAASGNATTLANIDAAAALIKAGAGINGLE